MKVDWVGFGKIGFVPFRLWAKRWDLAHFRLQCERSLCSCLLIAIYQFVGLMLSKIDHFFLFLSSSSVRTRLLSNYLLPPPP